MKRLFVVIGLASALAFGEETDIHGWQKAKWGMTEAEVLSVYKTEAKVTTSAVSDDSTDMQLRIPRVEVQGQPFEVTFEFDSSKKLQRVLLTSLEWKSDPVAFWTNLRIALADKYGEPSQRIARDEKSFEMWMKASGGVGVWFSSVPTSKSSKTVGITYRKRSNSSDL